jgi:hypothetical protein
LPPPSFLLLSSIESEYYVLLSKRRHITIFLHLKDDDPVTNGVRLQRLIDFDNSIIVEQTSMTKFK